MINKQGDFMARNEEKLTIRPFNLKGDYEQLIPFYDLIFEKELSSKGTSMQALLSEMKSFIPFFKFMGIFSKNYKHVFDGFVYENEQKEIVSTVNVGYSGNYWEIAMVATHPEYRRRGLAKKLIEESLEHAKKYKAKMCVLEVLEENTPAYQLYINYGFQHFDTKVEMKLPFEKLTIIQEQAIPSGYLLQKRKRDKTTNQMMFELEKAETPKQVFEFIPVNRIKYHKPFLMRILRPLVKLFISIKAEHWTIFHKDKLVGMLFLNFGKSQDSCHNIELIVDTHHKEKLIEPLITYALSQIRKNSTLEINTITEVRKSNEFQINKLLASGFEIFETDHLLGLKF